LISIQFGQIYIRAFKFHFEGIKWYKIRTTFMLYFLVLKWICYQNYHRD
jgi:hypothetical protein